MYRVTVKCLAYQIISPVQPQQLKLEEDNGTVKAWVFEGSYMHSSGQRPVPGICWSRSFTLCVLEMKGCHDLSEIKMINQQLAEFKDSENESEKDDAAG